MMPVASLVLLLGALLPLAATQAIWPVAYHDYQRSSLSQFTGPHGKWEHAESAWKADLNGVAFDLGVGPNSTALVGVFSVPGGSSSGSAYYSSWSSATGMWPWLSSSGFVSSGSSFSSGSSSSDSSSDSSDSSSDSSDSSSDDSSSDKRKRTQVLQRRNFFKRQAPVEQMVQFFSPNGTITGASDIAIDPYISVYAVGPQMNSIFAFIYDADKATIAPRIGYIVSSVMAWNITLGMTGYEDLVPPIYAKVEHFPVTGVVLAYVWSASNSSFAAVNATNGAFLWTSSSFFFTPTAYLSTFALQPGEGIGHTATIVPVTGLQVSSWNVNLATGVYSSAGVFNSAAVTSGIVGPTILSMNDSLLFVQVTQSTVSSYVVALTLNTLTAAFVKSFDSGITGMALDPMSGIWILFMNGTIAHFNRSPFAYDYSVDACTKTSYNYTQSPICDADGTVYVVCGHRVFGITANRTIRFQAAVKGGYWDIAATPVIGGSDLLYGATQDHLHTWYGSPHKKSHGFKWRPWMTYAIAGGVLVVVLVPLVIWVSCRRSRSDYLSLN